MKFTTNLKRYDPSKLEPLILDFWNKNSIYKKTKQLRSGGKKYYFLDGPPYVTGYIHLGTAWNKTLKDLYIRYLRMKGYDVRDQPGWDMHGLPIEVLVEKQLGVKYKGEIEEKIGAEKFIEECKKFALRNLEIMEKQFKRLGVWMDWENPYRTIDPEYMESEWWTFKRAWERGLVEKDDRVVHWCPRCETALADHEVEYEDVEDPSIYVKFKLKDRENEYILIWTTTPWTLPANLGVMVHPEYDYVKIKVKVDSREEYYWIAKGRLLEFSRETGLKEYEIVQEAKGEELIGLKYEYPLLEEMPSQRRFEEEYENVHTLVESPYVTLTEGTGFVHMAPGHGEEDFEIGRMNGLPAFSPLDNEGRFTEGTWKGLFVKEADALIIERLKEKEVLLWSGKIKHRYPKCWRCKSPLLFRSTEQWFLRVSKIKEDIIRENHENVKWMPSWVKKRYEDGVRNVGDWCISRQRYWNAPIPIWVCEKCGNMIAIGSIEELRERSKNPLPEKLDLHRPTVDKIILKCEKCDGDMKRIPDVLDVWIDSGVAGWASLGYPRRKDLFEQYWPADFIIEGQDQVLKWFYSQQVLSVVAFGTVPYRKVGMHGFVLDLSGAKMSKSKGNVVTPDEVIKEYGADTLRLYLLSSSSPWEDIRFNWDVVKEMRSSLDTLWNVYRLAKTYMDLDKFTVESVTEKVKHSLLLEDKWIISRVNTLIIEVEEALKNFEIAKAVRAINRFIVDDLSRWYGKLIRRRLWIESDDPEKLAAYWTLYKVFKKLLAIAAPFVPFITEVIYQSLMRDIDSNLPESVHMLDWPVPEERDESLEKDMDIVQRVYTAAAYARQKAGIKMRWPIKRLIIDTSSEEVKQAIERLKHIVFEMLNTKKVEYRQVKRHYEKIVKRNEIGKTFKGLTPKILKALDETPTEKLMEELSKKGEYKLEIDGEEVTVERRHVDFQLVIDEPNLVAEEIKGAIVVVDKTIDDEILSEGYTRDIVRRVQEMRKEMDLDIEEYIKLYIRAPDKITKLIKPWENYIKNETRAEEIYLDKEPTGYIKTWDIEGHKITIGIERRK